MRVRRLTAKAFRCIETVDVELGPGLNVLYGPNDHGKSTLALALRSALLLPPGSADAQDLQSWFEPEAPSVELVFEDDDAKVWRVSKTFGGGARASLEFSKDGITYLPDCRARQVEEKLRKTLGWGIPVPGGRGGPHGLPSSFLSQVLLAEQTNVIAVLESTLESDPDESGRVRLTKALKGLAQDPLFKRILDQAQAACDRYYTGTGQKKRGKNSPFAEAADATKRLGERLTEKDKQLRDSEGAEANALQFRDRMSEALEARNGARLRLKAIREAHERQRRLDGAKQLVHREREAVERILADHARVDAKAAAVAKLRGGVSDHETKANLLTAKWATAVETMRQADEAHRLATSEDAVRERDLHQAQLEKQHAELTSNEQRVTARRDRAQRALTAQQGLADAERLHRQVMERLKMATSNQAKYQEIRRREEELLKRADGAVAFGRWRAAATAVESARQRREDAQALRESVRRLKAEAAEKRAAAALRSLPSTEELKELLDLEKKRDLAEAALGGGLSLILRPRRALPIRTSVDGVGASRLPSSDAMEIQAASTIDVSIDDLVDLTVMAGAATSRHEVERLEAEWTQKVAPAMERGGVVTIAELQNAVDARSATLAEAEKALEDAGTRDARAADAEARAVELDVLGREAPAREEVLAGQDREELQQEFERLGATDSAAEREQQTRRRAFEGANQAVAEANTSVATAEVDLRNAAGQLERVREARDEQIKPFDGEDPSAVLATASRELDDLRTRLAGVQVDLRAVLEQRDSTVAEVERQRNEAAAKVAAVEADQAAAKDQLAQAGNALAHAEGELAVLREAVDKDDLPAAQDLLRAREADVAAVMAAGALATAEDVENAEGELRQHDATVEDVKQQLNQAEGALKHVGGAALRDDIADLSQARERAEARERDLEIQAEAWQLLRKALREAEDTEGAHLGRALAQPVTDRFAELTASRYGPLTLGPALTAQGVSVNGAAAAPDSVLEALSVGTKEQLATLLRLAIAEQLHSAIVLDDHLVQTDDTRLAWFRQALRSTATKTQVIILTCHPEDYVLREELPSDDGPPFRDVAAGAVRAIDLGRTICRSAQKSR